MIQNRLALIQTITKIKICIQILINQGGRYLGRCFNDINVFFLFTKVTKCHFVIQFFLSRHRTDIANIAHVPVIKSTLNYQGLFLISGPFTLPAIIIVSVIFIVSTLAASLCMDLSPYFISNTARNILKTMMLVYIYKEQGIITNVAKRDEEDDQNYNSIYL